MKRIMLTIVAAACVAVFLSACRSAPSHAPAFKDLHELTALKLDPKAVEQFLQSEQVKKLGELFRAMQFTPAELRKIRDSGDVRLMVGAVAVTDAHSSVALELLRLAIAKARDDPAPLAVLAYRATGSRYPEEIAEPEFLEALKRWRKLEPENSVPYYLETAWWAELEKFDEATRALAEASRHPKFNTHCAALRLDAVAAADFVGYPKFTARFFASTFIGEIHLTIAGRRCLRWEGANEKIARDCIILGQRREAERTTFMDEMSGTALQLAAVKKFPQTVGEAEVKRMEERRKWIGEVSDRMLAIIPRMPEKRCIAFLDQVLAESEAAAVEKLISEYGSSSK